MLIDFGEFTLTEAEYDGSRYPWSKPAIPGLIYDYEEGRCVCGDNEVLYGGRCFPTDITHHFDCKSMPLADRR